MSLAHSTAAENHGWYRMNKQQLLFNAWVTSVNTSLGRYIARLMTEADPHCTTEFTTPLPEVEWDLAGELLVLAHALFQKAADRGFEIPDTRGERHEPTRPKPAIPRP